MLDAAEPGILAVLTEAERGDSSGGRSASLARQVPDRVGRAQTLKPCGRRRR